MEVSCELDFEYGSEERARKLLSALQVDDDGYIETRVEGRRLLASARAKDVKSLVHTLDDFLACLGVAEETLGDGGARKAERAFHRK